MDDNRHNRDDKKAFYSDSKVVQGYDDLRFRNPGGQYVHQRESEMIIRFLSLSADRRAILDIPVGTGRMLPKIRSLGYASISAADYSEAMIDFCGAEPENAGIDFSRQDIYNTTFSDNSFSVILSSRFFFHSDDQDRLFREFSRILEPGGALVFDTLAWSPRTWTRLWSGKLGGNIYTNNRESIERLAHKHGFTVQSVESMLVLPNFFYNFLPKPVLNILVGLEKVWPRTWMTKRVWLLSKNG